MADHKTCLPLTPDSVKEAYRIIKPYIHRTPVLTSATLDRIASTPIGPGSYAPRLRLFFKCENFQKIGAFKARGAFHAVKHLVEELGLEEVQRRGVITHSSGNHAQALALAASTFSVPGYIVMPTISMPSKIAGTQLYADHVIFSGSTSQEREAKVEEVIKETGAILVPPYDHPDIILGQGTTGLELQEQYEELISSARPTPKGATVSESRAGAGSPIANLAPRQQPEMDGEPQEPRRLNAVIAPLGGGGLLSGIATHFSPTPTSPTRGTLIFGAEPSFQGGDDALRGLATGKRIDTVRTLTIADGLRTPVGIINWEIIRDKSKVEGVYAVTEEQIKAAMRLVLERMKVLIEPSGCVGLAVVLYDERFREMVAKKQEAEGREEAWDVAVVFSGGNTTVDAVAGLFGQDERWIAQEKGLDSHGVERKLGITGMNEEKRVENVAG